MEKASKKTSLQALDWLCISIGDVTAGIGPYLASYLSVTHNWNTIDIGTALSTMGLTALLAQIPVGLFVDNTQRKRLIICLAAAVLSISYISITIYAQFYVVIIAQALCGIAAAFAGQSIVAVSLGIVGLKHFAARMARNEAFNHVGSLVSAALIGLIGYLISTDWIFYLIAIFGLISIVSADLIREKDINHEVARGLIAEVENDVVNKSFHSSFSELLQNRILIAFALVALLYQLANASMLPLVGLYLSQGKQNGASLWIAVCIMVAQLCMIPTSIFAGKLGQSWGRKPVILIALAALPLRGLLYTFSSSPFFVIPVQVLDGLANGIFGVLFSVVVADLTEGSGCYNTARGLLISAQGIGMVVGNILIGYVVFTAGYNMAFFCLSFLAFLSFAICYFAVPETRDIQL